MGKFSQDKHQQANDALINGVVANDNIESLKEVLSLLSEAEDGDTKLADIIDAAIEAAIGENGAIETWADARYAPKSNG